MRDSILLGVAIGVIFPLIAFYLTTYTNLQAQLFPDKPIGFYVIAATINLVGAWLAHKKGLTKFPSGLILTTFIGALSLIFTDKITL